MLSVEIINGRKGTALMYNNSKIMASYVRIGFTDDGGWYLHKLRSDFIPSLKIQMEDDITASITLPAKSMKDLNPEYKNKSVNKIHSIP